MRKITYRRGATLKERFMLKIAFTESCWVWCGFNDGKDGYGKIKIGQKAFPAHRISHQLFKGEIPVGHVVMHKCDVPACVNPEHLTTGLPRDNALDAVTKGRHTRGDKVATCKLTESQVLEIRKRFSEGEYALRLGKEYGVSHTNILDIVKRKAWKHI